MQVRNEAARFARIDRMILTRGRMENKRAKRAKRADREIAPAASNHPAVLKHTAAVPGRGQNADLPTATGTAPPAPCRRRGSRPGVPTATRK